jgi:hypothetical protein
MASLATNARANAALATGSQWRGSQHPQEPRNGLATSPQQAHCEGPQHPQRAYIDARGVAGRLRRTAV